MKLIKWNNRLVIGINKIDEQHKEFINIMNKTYAIKNKDKRECGEVINQLIEFARIHFSTEEEYFEKWKYPLADQHKVEHEKILLKVLQLKAESEKDDAELIKDVLELLNDWLEDHFKKHDFKYKDYFKAKGFIYKV
jgi:hemerythrin-like metal-binding protein